ncbi:MAG: germination protein YpeB, partial [Clostridia bacterium]|nr:germination protein YpeB [Clostridia bacterium]
SQNMINGTEITAEEYETLDKLNSYASELGKKLNGIEEKLYNGELSFETASADIMTRVSAASVGPVPELENVEKAFEGYPSLIYDGPFSEHIENMEPVMLAVAPEISREAAFEAAKKFLGERGGDLEFDYETKNTKLDAYRFTANNKTISIGITKRGGYVLDFVQNRDVNSYNYDIKAATMSALAFLESRGIKGMKESYYDSKDNIATINFAYVQNGVKC